MFKEAIIKALHQAIGVKSLKKSELELWLSKPPEPKLGDIAFPCFKLKSLKKKEPKEIALELKQKIKLPKEIEKVEVFGPYLNFYLDKGMAAEKVVGEILKKKKKFGFNKTGQGKKVMVEFSAPNTNKPLHLGHVRNNSIGMAFSHLLKANSFKVLKANLINDRGVHITKSMLAYMKWGGGKTPKSAGKKGDHFVGDFYVLFNQKAAQNPELESQALDLLKKWEAQDEEARALWRKMNGWVFDGFNETYKKFGVNFDVEFFESELYEKGRAIVLKGKKKGVFREKEGAIIAELEPYGLPNKVLLRKDGTSLYLVQDLYGAELRFGKYKLDAAYNVVGSEQSLYFRQLFKILELLGYKWAKDYHHLSYGMVYLAGGKMKSREGTVIDADDIYEEIMALAKAEIKQRHKLKGKELEQRAAKIALSAIKFFMLKVDTVKDINFIPQESVSFEGETGPYLQYAHARAKSILRKAGRKAQAKPGKIDFSLLKDEKELELVSKLSLYPETVLHCFKSLSLHGLCHYLIDLSACFNSFYHESAVLKAGAGLKEARLALVEAFAQVTANGLSLLDIEAIEEM